jgi:HSP20 family molecular chaperone IbpA
MDLRNFFFHQPEQRQVEQFAGPSGWRNDLDRASCDMKPYTSILSADLIEQDGKYYVNADLPGVDDLEISVENGVLNIVAERSFVKNDAETHFLERSFGRIRRAILLPKDADVDNSDARLKLGVLTIEFPKKPSSALPAPNVKKIAISA